MHIAIVSATHLEVKPILDHIGLEWKQKSLIRFQKKSLEVYPLITGIGSMNMAFGISRDPHIKNIDLLLHLGICGSYRTYLEPGDVVEVTSEKWGDLGAEDAQGQFLDGYTLGLLDPNQFPYENGMICKSKATPATELSQVSGLSLNCASGFAPKIDMLKKMFECDVESMEGIGLFYASRMLDLPFVSIRAISNYVEPRNKESWKMKEAIEQLSTAAIRYLDSL